MTYVNEKAYITVCVYFGIDSLLAVRPLAETIPKNMTPIARPIAALRQPLTARICLRVGLRPKCKMLNVKCKSAICSSLNSAH